MKCYGAICDRFSTRRSTACPRSTAFRSCSVTFKGTPTKRRPSNSAVPRAPSYPACPAAASAAHQALAAKPRSEPSERVERADRSSASEQPRDRASSASEDSKTEQLAGKVVDVAKDGKSFAIEVPGATRGDSPSKRQVTI